MFNPLTGREAEVKIEPTRRPRQVMVAGGGLAGLEAATRAAQRGHHVTLYEQESHLGGQFNLAAMAPHKEDFLDVIGHQALMAKRAGVKIQLNTQVTPKMVAVNPPDVIILATGSIPLTIPFPGLKSAPWILASDLLAGEAKVKTPSALVIGGGLVGLETADLLAVKGVKVTLVEMLDEVGKDMDILAKTMLLARLREHRVNIHSSTKILRLTKTTAVAEKEGKEVIFPIETIIIAVGARSNRTLPDALAGSELELYVIGDAVEPRKALEAIQEGFDVGNRV